MPTYRSNSIDRKLSSFLGTKDYNSPVFKFLIESLMPKERMQLDADGEIPEAYLAESMSRPRKSVTLSEITGVVNKHLSARELDEMLRTLAISNPDSHAHCIELIQLFEQLSQLKSEERKTLLGLLSWTNAIQSVESYHRRWKPLTTCS